MTSPDLPLSPSLSLSLSVAVTQVYGRAVFVPAPAPASAFAHSPSPVFRATSRTAGRRSNSSSGAHLRDTVVRNTGTPGLAVPASRLRGRLMEGERLRRFVRGWGFWKRLFLVGGDKRDTAGGALGQPHLAKLTARQRHCEFAGVHCFGGRQVIAMLK